MIGNLLDTWCEPCRRSILDDAFGLIGPHACNAKCDAAADESFPMSRLEHEILLLESRDHRLIFRDIFDEILFFKDRISCDLLNIIIHLLDVVLLLSQENLLFFQLLFHALRKHDRSHAVLVLLQVLLMQFLEFASRNPLF